ncbi:MAG: right-handed parallel beta-helix repeat-containing protein, partial [Acidobacteriota bacterium]|nr:right-handed parallel beta-helix repeat-containing protein [Acidobacteriota bacterium]
MRKYLLAGAGLLLAMTARNTGLTVQATNEPELPRTSLNITSSPNTDSRMHYPATAADFQAALNAAQPGDTIILEAGTTYRGPFYLTDKAGAEFITIRSSRLSELPEGLRVTPAQQPSMPKLTSPAYSHAVSTVGGAHHYRFEGIEFAPVDTQVFIYNLIALGSYGAEQDSLDEVPHHLAFDRCYVHAFPGQEVIRGILLNSAHTDITNSHVSDFKSRGFDSQAVGGFNGPGPFRLINNYFEASGENVMFGGDDPSIPYLVHSDIEIRRNHFAKPASWRAQGWAVKNLFELKNARRVVIDGNLFENNWGHAQTGEAILFTPRNSGTAPWSVVEDIQFTNNIVRHAGAGINILGEDYYHPSQQTKRLTIRNNLFEDINGGVW